MSEIRKVGILGAGLMGSGIAEVCAKAGYEVVVREPTDELLAKGRKRVTQSLSKAKERGKLREEDESAILSRLHFSSSLEDLSSSDLVIEEIPILRRGDRPATPWPKLPPPEDEEE